MLYLNPYHLMRLMANIAKNTMTNTHSLTENKLMAKIEKMLYEKI